MTLDGLVLEDSVDAARRPSGGSAMMNEAQFELLYRKMSAELWSYLHRLTGDEATSDDLLQKTFLQYLRSAAVLSSDEHIRRYVYRIATNVAMDHFRQIKRERERSEIPAVTQSGVDRGDLRHDMMRVFGELKPQERALLWLAHVEGSEHAEISEALGVKPKSVRVLLFRARKKLAALLESRGLAPRMRP
jgi:RNA polymerase sigma-70 factor (ECF subfamily)